MFLRAQCVSFLLVPRLLFHSLDSFTSSPVFCFLFFLCCFSVWGLLLCPCMWCWCWCWCAHVCVCVSLSLSFFLLLVLAVEGGHRAVMFNRVSGVSQKVYGEGTHLMLPWFDRPVIYDVRTRPRNINSLTGSKGLCWCRNAGRTLMFLVLVLVLVVVVVLEGGERVGDEGSCSGVCLRVCFPSLWVWCVGPWRLPVEGGMYTICCG